MIICAVIIQLDDEITEAIDCGRYIHTFLEKQHRSDVQLFERLASHGITAANRGSRETLPTITALYRIEGFKGVLNWSYYAEIR